jgi:hypothetical protein
VRKLLSRVVRTARAWLLPGRNLTKGRPLAGTEAGRRATGDAMLLALTLAAAISWSACHPSVHLFETVQAPPAPQRTIRLQDQVRSEPRGEPWPPPATTGSAPAAARPGNARVPDDRNNAAPATPGILPDPAPTPQRRWWLPEPATTRYLPDHIEWPPRE